MKIYMVSLFHRATINKICLAEILWSSSPQTWLSALWTCEVLQWLIFIISPTSTLVQLDVGLFLEMLPWRGLCLPVQHNSYSLNTAKWIDTSSGTGTWRVKSLCQMASQFVFRLLYSTAVCPTLSWSHRCTIFIWVDAFFKQQLVW